MLNAHLSSFLSATRSRISIMRTKPNYTHADKQPAQEKLSEYYCHEFNAATSPEQGLQIRNTFLVAIKTIQENINHAGQQYFNNDTHYGAIKPELLNTLLLGYKSELESITVHRNGIGNTKRNFSSILHPFNRNYTNYTSTATSLRDFVKSYTPLVANNPPFITDSERNKIGQKNSRCQHGQPAQQHTAITPQFKSQRGLSPEYFSEGSIQEHSTTNDEMKEPAQQIMVTRQKPDPYGPDLFKSDIRAPIPKPIINLKTYYADWKDHKNGDFTLPNGDKYHGVTVRNQPTGKGSYTFNASGISLQGIFRNGMLNCNHDVNFSVAGQRMKSFTPNEISVILASFKRGISRHMDTAAYNFGIHLIKLLDQDEFNRLSATPHQQTTSARFTQYSKVTTS